MKAKKLALVGIGYWGKVHLKYLRKIKSLEIKKIFYRKNKPNLKNQLLNSLLTDNINEIKSNIEINYISIVTPIKTHTKILKKLLKKNINILIEKPLIFNKEEEVTIAKLIKLNNKIIVSYPYIYSKNLMFAKKQINAGIYGKLLFIEITLQQCGRFLEYNVNELLGPHAISIISMFYNINKIQFKKEESIIINDKCESSFIICKNNNKNIGLINLSLNYANKISLKIIKIFLENGTIYIDLNNKKYTYSSFKYERKINLSKVKKCNQIKYNENNNMKYVIEDFLDNKNQDIKKNFILTKKINEFIQS